MRYVCDAPRLANGRERTWFAIETQAEADAEGVLMRHAVAKHFERAMEAARRAYRPREGLASFERDIGLKDHIARTAPSFLTLRDGEGNGLATAMLPGRAGGIAGMRTIIVGPGNADPYREHADAIAALAAHLGLKLPRESCFPYG
jgi:hypothetical protein